MLPDSMDLISPSLGSPGSMAAAGALPALPAAGEFCGTAGKPKILLLSCAYSVGQWLATKSAAPTHLVLCLDMFIFTSLVCQAG